MNSIPLMLCADDYGQNKAISNGICDLIALKRLSAVSCMTTTAYWPSAAHAVRGYESQIDLGLHLNLTHERLLTQEPIPLTALIQRSFIRQLTVKPILAEFNAQWDQFVAHMQKPPDFIDGHQHIHHLPVVRDALLQLYQARAKDMNPYIRIATGNDLKSYLRRPNWIKQAIIHLTGAARLANTLKKQQIPHNTSFAGIYDFQPTRDYPELFNVFLETMRPGTLLMCHPGYRDHTMDDPINAARFKELTYFKSHTFLNDLKRHHVQLSRFQDSV